MEFELTAATGVLRYANNSNYKNDTMIRKEVVVSPAVIAEFRRIVEDSEITREDDHNWPEPDRVGKQELEVVLGGGGAGGAGAHIAFECAKIGSLLDVTESSDPEGLRAFYYVVQVRTAARCCALLRLR